eukprot:symbB.v1.2.000225.t1/scaffold4.1/size633627/7
MCTNLYMHKAWSNEHVMLSRRSKPPNRQNDRYLVVRESTIGRCWIDRFGCRFPPCIAGGICMCFVFYVPWMLTMNVTNLYFSQVFEADSR